MVSDIWNNDEIVTAEELFEARLRLPWEQRSHEDYDDDELWDLMEDLKSGKRYYE